MSPIGTKLPIRDVRSSAATGGKPDMPKWPESVAPDPKRSLSASHHVNPLFVEVRLERGKDNVAADRESGARLNDEILGTESEWTHLHDLEAKLALRHDTVPRRKRSSKPLCSSFRNVTRPWHEDIARWLN
jgi:hypothetical protein